MAFDQDDLLSEISELHQSSSLERCPVVVMNGVKLETTPVFDAYWYYAFERQNMFRRRLRGENGPRSSEDWILASHRFTNAYRASDRVSQYLIRHVIGTQDSCWSDEDIFFRVMLFKLFNRIKTWEALEHSFGDLSITKFDFEAFDQVLSDRQDQGLRNYSAAYIIPSAGHAFGHKTKHANHLRLIEWMLHEKYPAQLNCASSMKDAFDLMRAAPSLGPFLAYQFVTDLNYSKLTNFTEMEFVVAGPGALDGVSKCFVDTMGITAEQIIRHMAEHQAEYLAYYGFEFDDLWGRPLQLIDCQNIFCEISKYARAAYPDVAGISGRTRIKQKYKPAGRLPLPIYPTSWGLNEKIMAEFEIT